MINYMNIKEFREQGYLQELNRQFLHPLGLAMEIVQEEDGSERLGGVWDYRDDPEGMYFGEGIDLRAKAQNIKNLWIEKEKSRKELLGFMIQPTGETNS